MEMKELAKAFEGEPEKPEEKKKKQPEKPEEKKKKQPEKKKILPIVTFLIGLAVLIAGVAFLVFKLIQNSTENDAKRLVEIGTFVKVGEEDVVWKFSEVGKGKLTTDGYLNNYDFIWAIENGKLKIETNWFYDLNDEFDYKIDGNKLVLDGEVVFVPLQD